MRKYCILSIRNQVRDAEVENGYIYNCLVRFLRPVGKERSAPTFFLNIHAKEGYLEPVKLKQTEGLKISALYAESNIENSLKSVLGDVVFDITTYSVNRKTQIALHTSEYTMGSRKDRSALLTKQNKERKDLIAASKTDSPLRVMRKDLRSTESKLKKAEERIKNLSDVVRERSKTIRSLKAKIERQEASISRLQEIQKTGADFSRGRDYVLNQLGFDI